MNKRDFIKYSSLASLGIVLSGCSGYKRIPTDNWLQDHSDADLWSRIFYYASLAPSGHNTQPWLVSLNTSKEFSINVREESLLPAVDPTERETYLSLGAFMENLVRSAQSFGFDVEYEVTAKNTKDSIAVTGRFYKSAITASYQQIIAERRTVRSGFKSVVIETSDLHSCLPKDLMAAYYPVGEKESNLLNDMTYQSNVTQVDRLETQEELAHWIRWSNKDAKKYLDGLTPASMEIEGVSGYVVRNFYNDKSVLKSSFRKQTLKMVREQVNNHGGWVVLSSLSETPSDLIETGRKFQNFFLRTREYGIAVHPMTQILEEEPYKDEIAGLLEQKESVQFILRVGFLSKDFPKPVSLRRPVSSFLKLT